MGFGGPVWHASGRARTEADGWKLAEDALMGAGDARLGEWREIGGIVRGWRVVHLRRRLTRIEAVGCGYPDPVDVRGTAIERARFMALVRDVPHIADHIAAVLAHG
jgi:hypothetical protein